MSAARLPRYPKKKGRPPGTPIPGTPIPGARSLALRASFLEGLIEGWFAKVEGRATHLGSTRRDDEGAGFF
jgi:hypothetical protein